MSADKKARSALARGNEVSDSSTIPKEPHGSTVNRSEIDSQQAMSASASQAMLGINNNNGRSTISSDWRAHARPVLTEAGMAVGPDSPLANVTRVTGAGHGAIYAPTVRRATNASLLSNSSYGDYDGYSSNLPISPTLLTDRGSNAALAASIMDPRAADTTVAHTHNDRLLFNCLQHATTGPTPIGTNNGPNTTANAGYDAGAVTGGGVLAGLNVGPPGGPSGTQAGMHHPFTEMTNLQSPQTGSFQVGTRVPSAYSVSEYSNVSTYGYHGFDAVDEGADEQSPTVIHGRSQAGRLSQMDYAYCIPRGNGTFTPLVPADMLPGLRDIPATIRDTTHVQVLDCPHGMAPNGRSYYMQSIELTNHIDNVIARAPNPNRNKRTKVYCDKWVHDGTCAFTQQGCKFKHEMPFDRATQHELGLFHGLPMWWRKQQNELQRQRDAQLGQTGRLMIQGGDSAMGHRDVATPARDTFIHPLPSPGPTGHSGSRVRSFQSGSSSGATASGFPVRRTLSSMFHGDSFGESSTAQFGAIGTRRSEARLVHDPTTPTYRQNRGIADYNPYSMLGSESPSVAEEDTQESAHAKRGSQTRSKPSF